MKYELFSPLVKVFVLTATICLNTGILSNANAESMQIAQTIVGPKAAVLQTDECLSKNENDTCGCDKQTPPQCGICKMRNGVGMDCDYEK